MALDYGEKQKSVKIRFDIKIDLYKKIEEEAEKRGTTTNGAIVKLLEEGLSASDKR